MADKMVLVEIGGLQAYLWVAFLLLEGVYIHLKGK